MKTAEEWIKDSEGKWDAEYVRAIQADTFRAAASHIYHSVSDSMINMQRPNCSAIAHELEKAAIHLLDPQLG